jgi:hypothetical protein
MRLSKPSPALVIACLALFVALGGTAIATSRYMITSTSQIKPSVLGAIGAPGPDTNVNSEEVSIQPGTHGSAGANCATSEHVVTGGYSGELAPGALVVIDEPRGSHGWSVLIDNRHATAVSKLRAEALCAPGAVVTDGKTFK